MFPHLLLFSIICYSKGQEPILLWSEEFDSASITTPQPPNSQTWNYDLGDGTAYGLPAGWGNGELQTYTSELQNVRVQNNRLYITALREQEDTFTSGRIHTDGKFAFQYGSLQANISHPDVVSGLWSAFWTMGDGYSYTQWPSSGELDVVEVGWKGRDNQRIYSAAHWEHNDAYALHDGTIDFGQDLNGTFHVYRMDWDRESIKTYIGNTLIWEMDIREDHCIDCEEFHRPHAIRLNVAVGGGFTTDCPCTGGSSSANHGSSGQPACDDDDDEHGSHGSSGGSTCAFRTSSEITAPFPGEMQVDWVRVFTNNDTIVEPPPVETDRTAEPTASPSMIPTVEPSDEPTVTAALEITTQTPSDVPSMVPSSVPSSMPTLGPTPCSCTVEASYKNDTVSIKFNMCSSSKPFDLIGIFPCDAETMVTNGEWDQSVAKYNGGEGGYANGYLPDQVYVNEEPSWWSYTCGSPGSFCQQDDNAIWPNQGEVSIDPTDAYATEDWFFPVGPSLESGCYKVLLQRYPVISAPPYVDICSPWEEANSFTVVNDNSRETDIQGLDAISSGQRRVVSNFLDILFVATLAFLL